jgi:beta propeller domain-containing protein
MRARSLFLLLALLAACGKGNSGGLPQIQNRVTLARAATCESLTQQVHDTAVRQMRSEMDAWKGGVILYGLPAAAGSNATPAAAGGPASYSTTNTQVAGVDEADFVKNDGTRIFVLSGRTLFAATSWPPQDLAVAGKLEIEGWPSSMFLQGDQVVVFSSIWTVPQGGGMGPGSGAGSTVAALPCPSQGCYWGWPTAKVTVVDVSNLSNPSALSELYLPGYAAGARRVGSSVRLILSDGVRWPEAMRWSPAYDPELYQDKTKLAAAIDALENSNEAIIRATSLQSWFPEGKRKLADGTAIDVGYDCSDFYLSNAPERLGLVTIATLDLAHLDAGVSRASIVGEAGVLYATQDRLYLASAHWWWWPMAGQVDWTYVHGFDIRDPATARYFGSGGVEGHVPDQFAMDEHEGYLRVATNTVKYSTDPATPSWLRVAWGSRLSVLAPQPDTGGGTRLALVGEIPELEAGEALMASRFLGDRGFAVTFRYVDPLVTLDLSDPTHPKKVAELTLPGFSEYLQPIDANHLLAIGVDLPLNPDGRPDWTKRSLELSLFDVSDLARPKRTAQSRIGTAWAYSEALWDHHAFNWYRPDAGKPGLLAIPFSDWIQPAPSPWWTGFVSDVRVFAVDPATGISPLGSLGMGDVYIQQGSGDWTWWYRPWVRRSVMATDQAGTTFVYAVSDVGVRTAALRRLDLPLATALFPNVR